MDDYAAEQGWIDGEGNPPGYARLCVSMLNAERHALRALEADLRRSPDLDRLGLLEGECRRVRLEAESRPDAQTDAQPAPVDEPYAEAGGP